MTELELPGSDPNELGPLCRVDRDGRNVELDGCRQQGSQVGRVVGGSHQQQSLGVLREPADPLQESPLDRIRHR